LLKTYLIYRPMQLNIYCLFCCFNEQS